MSERFPCIFKVENVETIWVSATGLDIGDVTEESKLLLIIFED
jgi:hypothetical protein